MEFRDAVLYDKSCNSSTAKKSLTSGIQIGFVVVDGMSDGIKTFQCLLPPLLYHVRKKNALLCWIESAFVRKKRVGLPFLGKSTLIADCK